MKFSKRQTDTLQSMLADKFIKLRRQSGPCPPEPCPAWYSYLEENEIGRMGDDRNKMEGWPSGYLILINPSCGMEYIFVPKEFAERALILGFLP